jgi:hypothetical protein
MDLYRWLRTQWDRFGAWLCIGVGALSLLLGWIGMSSKSYPAEQLPYILSGGVFGVFLLGLGGILLLSADLRDEWTKLDRIEARLAAGEGLPASERRPATDRSEDPSGAVPVPPSRPSSSRTAEGAGDGHGLSPRSAVVGPRSAAR